MTRSRIRAVAVVAVLAIAGVMAFGGRIRAAVATPLEQRLREAVRLPSVTVGYEFGASQSMGWMMEDDPGDPALAIAELEGREVSGRAAAEMRTQVARLSRQLGDPEAWGRAVAAARSAWESVLDAAPDDPAAMAGMARVLGMSGETDRAEQLLRRALDLGQDRFEPWLVWSEHLAGRATFHLFSGTNGTEGLRRFQSGDDVPREALERATAAAVEALAAADRAVALQPESPLPFVARASARTVESLTRAAAAAGSREDILKRRSEAALPSTAVPDLEAAAARRPDDYRLQAAVVWHRYFVRMMESGPGDSPSPLSDRLPESGRRDLDRTMAVLERIARSPRKWVAAGAAETLAAFRMFLFGDPVTALELAERALAIDPTRRQARGLAMGILVSRKQWPRLVDLTARCLDARPEPMLWLIRAKAEFEQGHYDRAAESLKQGLARHPDTPDLLAARFALWIRSGDLPARADELRSGVEAVFDALRRIAGTPEGARLYMDVFPSALIVGALDGDLADSRRRAREWVAGHPEDEYGRAVLEILQSAP